MCIMIHKSISIKEEHDEWIVQNHVNLSRFVQSLIDSEIDKRGSKK